MNLRPEALFPVLRREEPGNIFDKGVVHRPIGAGLGVYLAQVGPTPRGTIGIDYVLQHRTDWSHLSVDAAFETAWRNLSTGLRISAMKNKGATFFAVEHSSGLAAAALGLPGFHEQASQWVGSPEVFIAIPDPSTLLAAAPGGVAESQLREAIHRAPVNGAVDLDPGCYILSVNGLRLAPVENGA